MHNMTELSQKMYTTATVPMSVAEAVSVLRESGRFRVLADTIFAYAGCASPKTVLTDGIAANHPQVSRDAAARRVRNWFNGSIRTISKMDAFEVCQILGLSLEETEGFVMQVSGEAIHWRDPEEIVWGYAILNKLSYQQTCALLDRAKELRSSSKTAPLPASGSFTADVKEKLMPLLHRSEDELLDFLRRNSSKLGQFHNTAYRLFMQYLDLLENGSIEDGLEDASKMTSREILESYLYRRIVPVSKQKVQGKKPVFTGVQQNIRMNWPDETTLSKMKNREMDIPRKVLILLFLATDGSQSEYEEEDEDEDILTRDEIFLNIYTRLNRMLQACGFQLLDPRNPFDWMILYCICVDDIWDTDQRLRDILTEIFPSGNGNQ